MKGVNDVLRVVLDDLGRGKNWDPVALTLGCLDPVHLKGATLVSHCEPGRRIARGTNRKAAGQTSDLAKRGLERLGQMMRDIVLKDCVVAKAAG